LLPAYVRFIASIAKPDSTPSHAPRRYPAHHRELSTLEMNQTDTTK